MTITPPALVTGPVRQPLPFGLFSVVAVLEDSSVRWEGGGIQFDQLGCPPDIHQIGAFDCEGDTPGLPKTFDPSGGLGNGIQFTVYGSYKCSPIGNPLAYGQEVATARLMTFEESRAEARLWNGSGDPLDMPLAFTEATPVDLDTGDLSVIIPAVETAIARGYGSLGVIHMSRANATRGIDASVLEVKGGRLQTVLGTPVIAGTGYEDDLIVGTPALTGYRSGIFTSSNRPGDLLDRANNDLYAVAERSYVLAYDDCGPWAFTVKPGTVGPIPGPPGASAYEIAVADGFVGTEAEWLESLTGPAGDAATVAVGTVTTGAAGSGASVANAGTPAAAVLDFSIPQGAPGLPGNPGVVQAIVPGDGVTVDAADPANPVISVP